MNWLLENPEAKLEECAARFNITQTWLSIVVHSDAFQDEFAKHRGKYYAGALNGLAEKLNGLAHMCVDKLAEKMESADDPTFILNATDKLLGRLGYGSKSDVVIKPGDGATIQVVSSSILIQAEGARKRLRELKEIEGKVIEKT